MWGAADYLNIAKNEWAIAALSRGGHFVNLGVHP